MPGTARQVGAVSPGTLLDLAASFMLERISLDFLESGNNYLVTMHPVTNGWDFGVV